MGKQAIIETVRQMLGRGLTAQETRELGAQLDRELAGTGCHTSMTTRPRQVGVDGIALIKRFEGCARRLADGRVAAYPDPGTGGAPWTIGWGATGPEIGPGTVWTQAQCDARLEADLARYAADVDRALGNSRTTQAQFDALVSFHYNTGAIARATLTRRHKAGRVEAAAAEFARWNRAGGRVMKGLVRRRAAERALYTGDERPT